VNEGDQVRTGSDTEANLVLFDRSTLHMYFGTTLELTSLRASRFIGSQEDVQLNLQEGTVVMSTAPADVADYSAAHYVLTVPDGEINVGRNSTIRVQSTGVNENRTTQVVLTFGEASVQANGRRIDLQPGQMSVLTPGASPTEARDAEQELIRNGNFREAPTSGKETVDGGGLGTAAWQPIFEQGNDNPGEAPAVSTVVNVIAETVPGQSIMAAWMHREVKDGSYARVGIRQDINAPVSFLKYLALSAAVKVGLQTDPVGGPQGDVFPLTIEVLYTDTDGKPQSWKQSFYYHNDTANPSYATALPLGAWSEIGPPDPLPAGAPTPTPVPDNQDTGPKSAKFILKQSDSNNSVGQNIAIVNSIEIYSIGNRFQSWVTDVSLTAR
jgi:hypothetical protein